jgi:ribose-phosphate pyrophosphokinase
LIGRVEGKNVLLVDDIIDTAGSVVAAVETLKDEGARDITVACVHPVLSKPAWARLQSLKDRSVKEDWGFRVVGTTAIHHTKTPDWYFEFQIEKLVSAVLEKINLRGSVTGVQDHRD